MPKEHVALRIAKEASKQYGTEYVVVFSERTGGFIAMSKQFWLVNCKYLPIFHSVKDQCGTETP